VFCIQKSEWTSTKHGAEECEKNMAGGLTIGSIPTSLVVQN